MKFRQEVELTDDELEIKRSEGLVLKCVLVRDWDNKAVWAHVIPRKGPDEEGYAARLIANDINWASRRSRIPITANTSLVFA